MRLFAHAALMLSLASFATVARATELEKLRVLYVGEPTNSSRAQQVTGFLQGKVGKIEAANRHGFQAKQAADFDVVILDWPQSEGTELERQKGSPLGPRANWHKPTVLLGSAGLNMAVVWKVRGGSG